MESTLNTPSAESADMFTSFPKLPVELRLIIWQYVLDSIRPRVISFQEVRWWNKTNKIPTLLHICRESRNLALGRYEWVSTGGHPKDIFRESQNARLYAPKIGYFIDYDTDIVMFSSRKKSNIRMPILPLRRLFKPVKRLLITLTLRDRHQSPGPDYLSDFILRETGNLNPNLKEIFTLTFVKNDDRRTLKRILRSIPCLVLRKDFVDVMKRHGTEWVRAFKLQGSESQRWWHREVWDCGELCQRDYKDRSYDFQFLDFEQWWRSQSANDQAKKQNMEKKERMQERKKKKEEKRDKSASEVGSS